MTQLKLRKRKLREKEGLEGYTENPKRHQIPA